MNFMRLAYPLACTLAVACKADSGDTTAASQTDGTSNATTAGTTETSAGTVDEPTTAGSNPETTDPTATTTPNPTSTTTVDPTGETTDDTTTGAPACPYTPVDGTPGAQLQLLASGFDRPVLAIPHPQDPDRLFVVEQGGHIKILEPGETTAPADDFLFVDVANANANEIGPEQGLLSLAFHPDFPTDPRIYINYNPPMNGGPTYIDEYTLDPNDPDKVDPDSRRFVYAVGQPATNHNGGMIAFGPDGYLYIGMGDGGGAGNTYNTARDTSSQLSKFLRIDVEPDGTPDSNMACADCPMVDGFDFTVPPDNPFVGDDAYAPEIWAVGLRNPWRWHFDSATGTLYAGDVGQGNFEEISVIEKGHDYGWDTMEGNNCFENAPCDTSAPPNGVNADGMTAPLIDYDSNNGNCSVTGLGVYHSCEVPGWDGVYFYADYCSSKIMALVWDGTSVTDLGVVATAGEPVIGSGATGHGDILVTTVVVDDFNTLMDGKVYRIAPAP